ncbi:MAG: hypothetical protein WD894_25010 [Pirellulales bacterium]
MRRNFYHNRRRLKLEQLESRQMLAGDVTVSVVGGDLFITGDNQFNVITLTATGTAGEFVVSGSGTTINGGGVPVTATGVTGDVTIQLGDDYDSLTFDTNPAAINFAGDLSVDLGQGYPGWLAMHSLSVAGSNNFSVAGSLTVAAGFNTSIGLESAIIGGDLEIAMSSDLGNVSIDGGSVGGDLSISSTGHHNVTISTSVNGTIRALMGPGNLELVDCDVGGDFVTETTRNVVLTRARIDGHVVATFNDSATIRTGFGAASPQFNHVGGNFIVISNAGYAGIELEYLNVEHDLVVHGGAVGNDVRLNNVRAGNSLLIETGTGNDIVWVHNSSADGEAAILAGAGSDYVLVGNFLGAHSLFVDTAAGFDLVNVSYASFVENLYVWLGGDSDQATVYAASAYYLSVDAGSGYDTVAIQYSAADHLFAGLGEGNDSLAVVGSLSRLSALLDGGAGNDLLSMSGNLLAGLVRQNFEAVGP